MKAQLTIFLLLLASIGHAQYTNVIYDDWTAGYSVGVHGRYQVASNAITSNFIWSAYQGKALSREVRESVSNKLADNNRLGFDIDFGIFAKHIPDSTKGLGWYLNVADRSHANGKYPRDMFDLAMFGNAGFAGETAELGDVQVTFLTYKQFELGLLKQIKTNKGKWNIGFGLSLLTGNRNLQIDISEADLYTHPDGDSLSGHIHGEIRSSTLSGSTYFAANGSGFSGAFHFGYQGKRFGLSLEADDLGFISWTKDLKYTQLDSTFVFEGAEVSLFSADGNPFSSINLDTVINGFATEKQGEKYLTAIAGRFRLCGYYKLNDKDWRVYAGIQYRISPGYIPYAFIGTSSPLPAGFYIDGRFAYGGFGSWHVGLELKKRFKDFLEIRLGTNNIEGYVLPMAGTSQSAYVGITGFF